MLKAKPKFMRPCTYTFHRFLAEITFSYFQCMPLKYILVFENFNSIQSYWTSNSHCTKLIRARIYEVFFTHSQKMHYVSVPQAVLTLSPLPLPTFRCRCRCRRRHRCRCSEICSHWQSLPIAVVVAVAVIVRKWNKIGVTDYFPNWFNSRS